MHEYLADVTTKKPGQKLAEIPTGTGDAIGYALNKQYGWKWAPLVCGGIESYATGGFNAISSLKHGYRALEGPLTLFGFNYTCTSTGASVVEFVYDFTHPAPETSALPTKVLKGSGPQGGKKGGVAPMLMNGPD